MSSATSTTQPPPPPSAFTRVLPQIPEGDENLNAIRLSLDILVARVKEVADHVTETTNSHHARIIVEHNRGVSIENSVAKIADSVKLIADRVGETERRINDGITHVQQLYNLLEDWGITREAESEEEVEEKKEKEQWNK